jgi:DNA end-binding protein Ku
METMLFSDELVPPDVLDELPDEDVTATDREVQMAQQLIESLASEFDPGKYRDEYRERVLDLIERKAQGQEIVVQTAPEEPTQVPDLMAALEASLAEAKGRKPPSGNGRAAAKKPSAAKKPTPAKKTAQSKKRAPAAKDTSSRSGSKKTRQKAKA